MPIFTCWVHIHLVSLSFSAVCDRAKFIGSDWYDALNFAGFQATDIMTKSDLLSSLSSLDTATSPPSSPGLISELSINSACSQCILDYTNTVHSSLGDPLCGPSAGWDNLAVATFHTPYCFAILNSAIKAFNQCSTNGWDIRTGSRIQYCSRDEYVNVEEFYPYGQMVNLVANSVPMDPEFIFAYSRLPCRNCFQEFIINANPHSDCIPEITSQNCLDSLASVLNEFRVCIDIEHTVKTFQTNRCSENDKSLVQAYKPYFAFTYCAS